MHGGGIQSSTNLNVITENKTVNDTLLSEKEQSKIEFYKTYDVMTGVRIAATLGGFLTLMVLFLLYKSRCNQSGTKSITTITDNEAMLSIRELPSTSIQCDSRLRFTPRNSIGNFSAPAVLRGHNLTIQQQLQQQQQQIHSNRSSFLVVPGARFSSTGSTSDSSYYLEQSCSVELSIPDSYYRPKYHHKRHSTPSGGDSEGINQRFLLNNNNNDGATIDITLIQPTPDISPCNSKNQLEMASYCCSESDVDSIASDSVFDDSPPPSSSVDQPTNDGYLKIPGVNTKRTKQFSHQF